MRLPQVFIAEFRGGKLLPQVQQLGWGRMWVLLEPNPRPGEPWAFDNGAFRDYTAGRTFNDAAYQKRLERAYKIGRPTLAVVPDIVAGGERSLEFSLRWLDRLPKDWPWYLAIQDGMWPERVEAVLPEFAGLFLGGTNQFKASGALWARMAARNAKKFHYGRAGTIRKLDAAYNMEADSLDSAFPLWTKARWREFVARWQMLDRIHQGRPVSLLEYLH